MLDDVFDRYQFASQTAVDCLRIFRRHKSLLLFPLFSTAVCLLILLSLLAPEGFTQDAVLQRSRELTLLVNSGDRGRIPATALALLLLILCLNSVILFFNAALVHCYSLKTRGQSANPLRGLLAAARCLPGLVVWSLFSLTIGLCIRVTEMVFQRNDILAKYLLIRLSGVVWSVAVYFAVPMLVLERTGPLNALRNSVRLLARIWGKQVSGYVGIGFFMLPAWLIGLALLGSLLSQDITASQIGPLFPALGLVTVVMTGLIQSTLGSILQTALYHFAAERYVPPGWRGSRLQHAFYVVNELD
ncbi:MAG: hypothetical protein RL215_3240 [Planctomycetota bacterium]